MQEKPIRGDIIKNALDSLDVLGLALKELLIEYIEKHGKILDSRHFYTCKEIESEIIHVFGEDAARLVIQRVRKVIGVIAT